jgi:DNA-binding NtrC family response regulator
MPIRKDRGRASRPGSGSSAKSETGIPEMKTNREISAFEEDLVRLKFERDVLNIFIEHARLNNGPHLRQFLESMEKTILCRLLERFNGCQRTTAKYLGMKYTTLNEKVKKHRIGFFKHAVRLAEESRPAAGSTNL